MWKINPDTKQWTQGNESYLVSDFKSLQADLKSLRFYQKFLSGSTYIGIDQLPESSGDSPNGDNYGLVDINNIYSILDYTEEKSYYYDNLYSPYTLNPIISNPSKISSSQSSDIYLNRFSEEYGFTLKNLFTPDRLINDQLKNFIYVDVASTSNIEDLTINFNSYKMDGVLLQEGMKVLIKDQYDLITIPNSIDPKTYFDGYYTIGSSIGNSITYIVPNYKNGIYTIINKKLIRTNDIDTYDNCKGFSVVVKLGEVNREKQYKLDRLSNGYYPLYLENKSIYFKESHKYVVRNRVDYNNLFELSLQSILKHDFQQFEWPVKYNDEIDYITHYVPGRKITVGEFGSIICDQENVTTIINTKYHENLKSITQTTQYYWVVGERGTLLRINKVDFHQQKIDLNLLNGFNVLTTLLDIKFYNDLLGVLVGKFNQIWCTQDGGNNWSPIFFKEFEGFNFNKIIFTSIDKFYVGGDNGVFIEFTYSLNIWSAYQRRISKWSDSEDEYVLIDHIKELLHFTYNNSEFISIGCSLNHIYLYDLNSYYGNTYSFLYVDTTSKGLDITGLDYITSSQSLVYSTFEGIWSMDILNGTYLLSDSNIISVPQSISLTQSAINDIYYHESSDELIITGNNSLWKSTNDLINYNDVYDSTFFDRLRPKLLFMDYDIGSKLYWFDDYGQYRLPNRYQIPTSYLIDTGSTHSYLDFSQNTSNVFDGSLTMSFVENNWITYWQDRSKTFEYNTELSDSYKVVPSFKFTLSETIGKTFSLSSITTNYSDIQNLMPYRSPNQSRFRQISTITSPSNIYDLYLYDYLGIWKLDVPNGEIIPEKGDVIYLESNIVKGKFMINKIFTVVGSTMSSHYQYFYTDFNENITNNLSGITVQIQNLNKFNNNTLLDNLKKHYISLAYSSEISDEYYPYPTLSPIGITQSLTITPKYGQYSAYYNLQSTIKSQSVVGLTASIELKYPSGFLSFGYTPTYNLLSYLNYINPNVFIPNYEFATLPIYIDIPGPDSISNIEDKAYIDTGNISNKIWLGTNLKNIWDSLRINTFIDLEFDGQLIDKCLLLNKYWDNDLGMYVLEFHKELKINSNVNLINIKSRRKLSEISSDLQYVNGLHRPNDLLSEIQTSLTFSSYETKLNFKVNTDSYTRTLLSDSNIISYLNGILYTDYKNELALQITRLDKKIDLNPTSIYQLPLSNRYGIAFGVKHGLQNNDGITITLNGIQSSPQQSVLLGYHTIQVINDYIIELPITYIPYIGSIKEVVSFVKSDPFLNFQPVDIFDLGVSDRQIKQSVEIFTKNQEIDKSSYNIVNLDLNKYKYRLIDGLDLLTVNEQFPWILEAEISNAVIGIDSSKNIIWYNGIWEFGRWFGGTWISGQWITGDWYGGTWESKSITDLKLSVKVDSKSNDRTKSVWFDGRWFGGTWNNGTWFNGRWYGGDWTNGRWYGGTWNDGTWNDGEFFGGLWILGNWWYGKFNTNNGPAYWLDGNFYGGDFENGIWYNGVMDEKNDSISRFGVNSSLSRQSIWKGGKWIKGQFHSLLNEENGNPKPSINHSFSTWETGIFTGGVFYGGIVKNISFNNSIWEGGILEDINIIEVNSSTDPLDPYNKITISGLWEFNIGDDFYIIDNQITSTFSIYGSTKQPLKYKVLNNTQSILNNSTTLYCDNTPGTFSGYPLNLKCVSNFENAVWNSGVWENGVWLDGTFNGGLWLNGYFKGIWG